MVIRGFVGPEKHEMYLTNTKKSNPVFNFVTVLALIGLAIAVKAIE